MKGLIIIITVLCPQCHLLVTYKVITDGHQGFANEAGEIFTDPDDEALEVVI